MKTDAELARIHARARHAWDHALDNTPPWTDPRRDADIDTRAENRRDQDNYEYAQLMLREMDA